MPLVAGIDSSTQSCKVELRDLQDGTLVGSGNAPHPAASPPCSEQDPAAWWDALTQAFAAAVSVAAVHPSAIVGLAVDAQCHGLVALDRDENPVRRAKLWNDTTSAEQVRRLRGRIGEANWIHAVGSLPTAAFTYGKLAWLAECEPGNFARTRHVLLPHDWLILQLTGRRVTDRSEASGTGYYSAAQNRYLTEFLLLIDADKDWSVAFPQVCPPSQPVGTVLGAVAARLGVTTDTLVGPGGGDQQSAALGLGVLPGDVVYTFATSGVVYTASRHPVFDLSGAVDGVADMTDGYLPLVSTLNATRVTATFSRILGVDLTDLADLALRATPGRTPVLAAFLDGERTPDRPHATGTLTGLTSATGREEMARSAFDGVILGLLDGERKLNAAGVDTSGRLLATGGGARSRAYTQLLADLSGREVHVADAPEASARGACVQAAAVVAGAPVVDVLQSWAPPTRVAASPRAGTDAMREELRERYELVAGWDASDGRWR